MTIAKSFALACTAMGLKVDLSYVMISLSTGAKRTGREAIAMNIIDDELERKIDMLIKHDIINVWDKELEEARQEREGELI